MNIKQAPCMARIVAPYPSHPAHNWIVRVIERAPDCEFRLPDGVIQIASPRPVPAWVCESLMASPFTCPVEDGRVVRYRQTRFCVIDDMHLRPLADPGDDAVDESLTWCPRPEQVEAMS